MPYIVIKGTYHLKGREPDGDSIGFLADDQSHWAQFKWKTASKMPKPGSRKTVQLRIEAIDALETHYEGYCQPKAIAKSATDALLKAFGAQALTYSLNFTKIVTAKDDVPGFIISKGLDGYDRPICYAVIGDTGLKDGQVIAKLTQDIVKNTVNYQLAWDGLAYPTFYQDGDIEGYDVIAAAAVSARNAGRGIWTFDRTQSGFTFWGPHTIYEDVVILPKLFRRMVTFCETYDKWEDFDTYVKSSKDPFEVIGTDQSFKFLGDLLEVDGRHVRMKFKPEEIRFGEKAPGTSVSAKAPAKRAPAKKAPPK